MRKTAAQLVERQSGDRRIAGLIISTGGVTVLCVEPDTLSTA